VDKREFMQRCFIGLMENDSQVSVSRVIPLIEGAYNDIEGKCKEQYSKEVTGGYDILPVDLEPRFQQIRQDIKRVKEEIIKRLTEEYNKGK
jgi:hypothetical protein